MSKYLNTTPTPLLFPASHHKGLFGFIVQEGLCAQLAHLYRLSLWATLRDCHGDTVCPYHVCHVLQMSEVVPLCLLAPSIEQIRCRWIEM